MARRPVAPRAGWRHRGRRVGEWARGRGRRCFDIGGCDRRVRRHRVVAIAISEVVARRRRLTPVIDGTVLGLAGLGIIAWLLGRPDSPLCDPGSWAQPHGLWHLLSALIVLAWVVQASAASASRRSLEAGSLPEPAVLRSRPWPTARSCSSCSAGSSCCSSPTACPVEIVAFATALTLWATDVLDLDQALAGFGDPTVLFIAALFVVSEALDATGVTAWAGQQLVAGAGDSRRRLLVLMMVLCALLTAVISVNGAVAALIPVVVVTAVRLRDAVVAADDAAGVRRPRRLAAGAHRDRRSTCSSPRPPTTPGRAASGSSSSRSSASRCWSARSSSSCSAGEPAAAAPQRPVDAAATSASRRGRCSPPLRRSSRARAAPLFSRESGVAEVVIPPRSGLDRRARVSRAW